MVEVVGQFDNPDARAGKRWTFLPVHSLTHTKSNPLKERWQMKN